jgi:hypothetical protein
METSNLLWECGASEHPKRIVLTRARGLQAIDFTEAAGAGDPWRTAVPEIGAARAVFLRCAAMPATPLARDPESPVKMLNRFKNCHLIQLI